jgi:TRAP-type C4-dicarboxylate transport system permease small subunit
LKGFFSAIKAWSDYMYWISGFALACIMLITTGDVILRAFNRPIAGVYDLTMFLGGVVIGLAIPRTTWKRAHVRMVFFIEKVPSGWKKVLMALTSVLGIFIFLLIGRSLLLYGLSIHKAREVSMTIHLPFYPVVYGMGVSCLINSIVILYQLLGIFGMGEKHES